MSKHFTRALFSGALTLGGLWLFNKNTAEEAVSKNILKSSSGNTFSWKFGDIYYRKAGEGDKTLLLIHDATAFSSSYEWSKLVAPLRGEYTIYAIDLPGCGRSDKPLITYTNYLYVQAITTFIKEVIGKSVTAVATGFSASFLTMAASAEPTLYEEVVMVNPTSLKKLATVPDDRSRAMRTLISLPVIGTTIYNLLNSKRNLEYQLEELYFFNPFHLNKKIIDACYEAAHYNLEGARFFQGCLDGRFINWNIRFALSKLQMPVKIVYGNKLKGAADTALTYKKENDAFELIEAKDAKMFPHFETPELFAKLFL